MLLLFVRVCVTFISVHRLLVGWPDVEMKKKKKTSGGVFSLSLSLAHFLVKFKTRLFFHHYSNVFEELKK